MENTESRLRKEAEEELKIEQERAFKEHVKNCLRKIANAQSQVRMAEQSVINAQKELATLSFKE